MTSDGLLAAAFSASSGRNVKIDKHGESALIFHESMAIGGPVGKKTTQRDSSTWKISSTPQRRYSSGDGRYSSGGERRQSSRHSRTSYVPQKPSSTFSITLKMLNGHVISAQVRSTDKVYSLKKVVENEEGTPSDEVHLQFAWRLLNNHRTLAYYNVQSGSCIHVVHGPQRGLWDHVLAAKSLAPEYNYDFTNVKDDGKTFIRGGEPYRRPCGWKRFAIRVHGKYADDAWLGAPGMRTKSSDNEWPVSYHGTSEHNAQLIADAGYDLTKGKRFAFGHGIYTTPDIDVAQRYATKFEFEGKSYLMILQNRVNPLTFKKVHGNDTGEGEYWISPDQADVRPYGVLVKEASLN